MALALRLASRGRRPADHGVIAALLTLAVLACLSAALAAKPDQAFRELALLVGLIAIAAVAAEPDRGADASRWLPVVLVSVSSYAAVILMVALLQVGATGGVDAYTVLLGHDNPRAFNHVQTVALPLAAAGLVSGISWVRRLSWVALLISGILLGASAGRGTVLSLAAAVLCLLLTGKRQARRIALRLLVAISLAVMLGWLMFHVLFLAQEGMPAATQAYAPSRLAGDQSRLLLWSEAFHAGLESPWLGVGPGHLALGAHAKAAHPHNAYLQMAAEYGLPAMLLVLGLLVMFLRRLVRAVRASPEDDDGAIGCCLLAAWAALLTDSFLSGVWVMPVSQVWIALLAGWSAGWLQSHEKAANSESPRSAKGCGFAISGVLIATQVALWVSVWPEICDLPAHLRQVEKKFPSERAHPRFWSHGHF